ncbi:T9SS type A sorting domain-containing protein [Rapidithrix thailandica]|uniref:T9SS type A sorting domain-containing protein n=1 Tax=Rapidithrix thailandica TaxID=413964 RepID=A0AAW9S6L9_9BACT
MNLKTCKLLWGCILMLHLSYFTAQAQTWLQKQKVFSGTYSKSNESPRIGYSVAMDGNTAVVGAPYNDEVEGALNNGLVYVYEYEAGQWHFKAKLFPSLPYNRNLGLHIAISGDVVVVGLPRDNVNEKPDQGAAYMYVKPASGWADMTETAILTASDGQAGDQLGTSVAIEGEVVVVGATKADVDGKPNQGKVYVYEKPDMGWQDMTETARLKASDGSEGDHFGYSIAIKDRNIAVGSPYDDASKGAVYLFENEANLGASAVETAKLTALTREEGMNLGNALAFSGDAIVASAFRANNSKGAMYVFEKPLSGWTHTNESALLTASDANGGEHLGYSLACTENSIAAGAPGESIDGHISQGALYLFEKTGQGWGTFETKKIVNPSGNSEDMLGYQMALSDQYLLAGAPYRDTEMMSDWGGVFFIRKPAEGWTGTAQIEELSIPTWSEISSFNDLFGAVVAMDATLAVVIATSSDEFGRDQGVAYLFELQEGYWNEVAKLSASDLYTESEFGVSVAVSSGMVAIGAHRATIEGKVHQGAVYLFEKPASGWKNMTETAVLTASDGQAYDYFGSSLAIERETLVVGAYGADHAYMGAAYVFEKSAGTWNNAIEVARLTSAVRQEGAMFGYSVSISQNTIVVGSKQETTHHEETGSTFQGAVYVFEKPVEGWGTMTETARLTSSDGGEEDGLGGSIAISEGCIVAGASGNENKKGAAYLFVKPAEGWVSGVETAKLTASDGQSWDHMGSVVDLYKDTVVVGMQNRQYTNAYPGKVYYYIQPESGWVDMTETAIERARDEEADDEFGQALAIHGKWMLVGAFGDDESSPNGGAAYFYYFDETVSGIKDEALSLETKLYPNPVSDEGFTLEFPWAKGKSKLEILDLNGRAYWQTEVENSFYKVLRPTLPKGVYLIRILNKNGTSVKQFLRD